MTLEEESRLSYYKRIAAISSHENVMLVQHVENRRIYVEKIHTIYDRRVYELLKDTHHPFFPEIVECVEEDERLIVIESYISGETLQSLLERGKRFTEEETAKLMVQICDGIAVLHSQQPPIVHRDIKPSNLILTDDGILKLVDCNAARQYEDGKMQDTTLFGTRGFAAPEQYGFRQTDPRSDIYSMGILANVLLTGHEVQEEVWSGKAKHIIDKCTEMEPENRYRTIGQLRRAWKTLTPSEEEGKEKSFLPPGFRSNKPWKMMLAVIMYLILIYLPLTLEVKTDGVLVRGIRLRLNRGAVLLIELGCVVLWGDFCGFQEKLRLPDKNRILRWAALVGYTGLWFVLIVVLLEVLVSGFL